MMTPHAPSLEELKSSRISVSPNFPWVSKGKVKNADRYRGTPVTCLLSDRQVHVPSKTVYRRLVNRLESSTAVQQLSRVDIPFDPVVESLTIHSIAIFRGGELTNYADHQTIELIRREQQLEAGVLNGQVSALTVINDVRVGDILDLEFSITTTQTLYGRDLSVIQQTETPYFIGRWNFSWIDTPEHAPGISRISSQLDYSEIEESGLLHRSWSASRLLHKEPEANLPPDVLPFAFLQISTFENWREVVSPILPHWQCEPNDCIQLDLEVNEIRRQAAGDSSTMIDMALASARDAVRYLAYSPGLLAVIPADLGLIWERRYGDCKEKTLLLCWLLCELGMDAAPVLVNTVMGKSLPNFLPAPILFDHVVARVSLPDRTLWLDATDLYRGGRPSRWTHLPHAWGLPLSESTTDLVEIPNQPSGETYLKIHEVLKSDGKSKSIHLECRFEAGGRRADWLRGMHDSQGIDGIRGFLKQFMNSTRRDIEIPEDPVWRDDRLENRVEVEFNGICREGIQPDPEYARDRLSIAPFSFVGLLPILDKTDRQLPLALNGPDSVSHEVIVNHPKAPKVPDETKREKHSSFEVKAASRMEGGSPAFLFSCSIIKDRVEPAAMLAYRNSANRAYGLFDLSFNLPVAGRRQSGARDPELNWGGGISSPEAARVGEAKETGRIVQFVVLGTIALLVLTRLVFWILAAL